MVVKTQYSIPVKDKYKDFCEYMEYELLDKKGEYAYYFIPPGHICRFKINYERWLEGNFDRNSYLEKLEKQSGQR